MKPKILFKRLFCAHGAVLLALRGEGPSARGFIGSNVTTPNMVSTPPSNQDPNLSRVFTTFSATNPSIYLDIDRDKAQVLGVSLSAVFQALQASLGGLYVNDVNLYGRRWQVQVQAEAEDRKSVDDIYRINVRTNERNILPFQSPLAARRL